MHHTLAQAAMEWGTAAVTGGGAWWLFSTAVRTMPKPDEIGKPNVWYKWCYNFFQTVAANRDLKCVDTPKV